MKILPVHSNYSVRREKINHVNSIQNMSKPYAADTVSFGGIKYVLEENQQTDNVRTILYHGKKNSVADNVTAARVILEDGARIKKLIIKDSLFKPQFPREALNKNIANSGTDLLLYDNSQIDSITDTRPCDPIILTSFVCTKSDTKSCPVIKEKDREKARPIIFKYFVNNTHIKDKIEGEHEFINVIDNVNIDTLECRSAILKNNAKVKYFKGKTPKANIDLHGNSFIQKIENASYITFTDNARAGSFDTNIVTLNGHNYVESGKAKEALVYGYAKIKNLECEKIILGDCSPEIENLKTNTALIKNKAVVKNIDLSGSLTAKDKAVIGNIKATEDKASVTLMGNASVTGKIEFIGEEGKVYLKKDPDTGKIPVLKSNQVINGKIYQILDNGDTAVITKPKGFAKVAGMTDLKKTLYEDIIYPMSKTSVYKDYGLTPINGCLLYGPPGCGKTFIIEALSEESNRYYVELPASSVGSKYQHETVKNISQKFKEAIDNAPSLLFIDEVDAMAPSRENLAEWDIETSERVTELLQQINNCKDKDVFVIFASNEPQKIDSAIKRTGRIDKKIFIGPPDKETRKEIFERKLNKIKLKDENINTDKLAELTNNYTAEDIRMIVRQAAITAMNNNKKVSFQDLIKSIEITKPSLTDSMIELYKKKGEI